MPLCRRIADFSGFDPSGGKGSQARRKRDRAAYHHQQRFRSQSQETQPILRFCITTNYGGPPDALLYVHTKQITQMQRLDVICPPAPWENTTTDEDRAWDLCLSLSEEYGYAQVRQNGIIIGDYTNGR